MRHLDRRFLACFTLLLAMTAACNRAASTTTTTGAVKITDVTLGRSIGGDKAITDKTEDFRPNDTIYASVATDGAAANTALRAKWTYEDGQVVDDSTRTIAPNTRERTEFHIAKPNGWPTGKYQVEIFLNGTSAETKKFEVK
ncbi:MAG: hypothetical protein ABIS06_16805 [Vicinamibacterales bacterium]